MPRRSRPSPNAHLDALPDVPEVDLSRFRGMDDISVVLLLGTDPDARLEVDRRYRFEHQWSGIWTAGPENGWRSPR